MSIEYYIYNAVIYCACIAAGPRAGLSNTLPLRPNHLGIICVRHLGHYVSLISSNTCRRMNYDAYEMTNEL